jgi:hypothetical protein
MSPGPPSTAPSTRWAGPPDNDCAVRWWTARAIWLGRPEPVLGDLGRRAIDPAWRRRHRTHWPLGPPGRTAMPNGTAGGGRGPAGSAHRPGPGRRSTIDADRVDQMCAESAAQPARRSVSWPAAHRIPPARRWLICALYAARVRSRRSWAHCPLPQAGWGERPGDGERFTCAGFAQVTSPARGLACGKGRARLQLPPPAAR